MLNFLWGLILGLSITLWVIVLYQKEIRRIRKLCLEYFYQRAGEDERKAHEETINEARRKVNKWV